VIPAVDIVRKITQSPGDGDGDGGGGGRVVCTRRRVFTVDNWPRLQRVFRPPPPPVACSTAHAPGVADV